MSFSLKNTASENRLAGIWHMMTGFRLAYVGATISLALANVAKTSTFLLIAYFMEIPYGYIYAAIISTAIFMMILLNQAWWMAAVGIFIMIGGIVHLIRFIKKYPLASQDESHAE